jgi:hypothetical protein
MGVHVFPSMFSHVSCFSFHFDTLDALFIPALNSILVSLGGKSDQFQ